MPHNAVAVRTRHAVPPIDYEEIRRVFRAPLPTFNVIASHPWGGRQVGRSDIPTEGHRVWPSRGKDDEAYLLYVNLEEGLC
jgi:hypothetical protein